MNECNISKKENINIRYVDPAGNITAIVKIQEGAALSREDRIRLSGEILDAGLAEQVGFEAAPIAGGDCRLEMMGGEFCGNAARAYGFMHQAAKADQEADADREAQATNTDRNNQEARGGGTAVVRVEISGAASPVSVTVDSAAGEAYAVMPLPLGTYPVSILGGTYPLIRMAGIDHILAEDVAPDAAFVVAALKAAAILPQDTVQAAESQDYETTDAAESQDSVTAAASDGLGIMFINGDQLVPAVYVRATDSLVWESSCGSGSVAAAWYKVQKKLMEKSGKILHSDAFDIDNPSIMIANGKTGNLQDSVSEDIAVNHRLSDTAESKGSQDISSFRHCFKEPGGEIIVDTDAAADGRIISCRMGGKVKWYE